MKKLCLLLALCLTVLCVFPMGAGAEAADPALSAMVQRALKLADIMQECAQSEAYCSLYAGSAEIGALCAAMGEGPYDAPVSGALLTLSPEKPVYRSLTPQRSFTSAVTARSRSSIPSANAEAAHAMSIAQARMQAMIFFIFSFPPVLLSF